MNTPRACVLLATGFEEIEAVTIVDVLRRADIEVTILRVGDLPEPGEKRALDDRRVVGSHGIVVEADADLKNDATTTWDLVVLPGGLPGAIHLRDSAEVQALVRRQHEAGRGLAAICAAPIALGAAGVLEGKRATSYPGFEEQLTGAACSDDRVCRDGHIVTSRGPATAIEFALELVRELRGENAAEELRDGMLVSLP